jgi:YbbR domain-containing protein
VKKDFWIKVASVLLAVALWLFVMSRGQTEVSMQVPLVLENVPSELRLTGERDRDVFVDIKGHERFINNIKPGDIRVVLDLGHIKKGRNQLSIGFKDVDLPPPLKLINIMPSTVSLNAVRAVSKKVPVSAVVEGRPQEGFVVRDTEVSPKEVTLTGVRKQLGYISSVKTEPVDISSAARTVEREVKMVGPNDDTVVEPGTVTVRVIIAEEGQ